MRWAEIGQDAFGSNIEYSLLRVIDEIVDAATVGTSSAKALTLKVFPNPVQDRFTLVLPHAGTFQLRISDLNGRVVLENTLSENELQEISVEHLPAGMYTITMFAEREIRAGKFIKA